MDVSVAFRKFISLRTEAKIEGNMKLYRVLDDAILNLEVSIDQIARDRIKGKRTRTAAQLSCRCGAVQWEKESCECKD